MSEWDFLFDLSGQELFDAMGCGYNPNDITTYYGWDDIFDDEDEEDEGKAPEYDFNKYFSYLNSLDEHIEDILSEFEEEEEKEEEEWEDDEKIGLPALKVFIDAENVSHRYMQTILRFLELLGTPEATKFYNIQKDPGMKNWHKIGKPQEGVKEISLAGQPQKNKCDIKIMEDMEKDSHIGLMEHVLVLVTSDADFIPKINELKKKKFIIGIGEKKAPDKLREAYTKFFELPPLNK